MKTSARIIALAAGIAALPLPAPAANAAGDSDDLGEFNELLAVMSEETDIATRTKMNSDFVPGIVSVLDGGKMSAMGARTVSDALSFIPGVQSIRDNNGNGSTQVRGVPYPFNNGNIQILLNGVPVSRDSAGINTSALELPIAQVERIEFVRGPGSVVYGEFAFQGLVNIVTREQGSAVAVEADDRQTLATHVRVAEQAGDWRLAANLSASDSGDALLPDNGQRAENMNRFALLSAKGNGFSLSAQGIEREQQDTFAPPPDVRYDEDSWSLRGVYEYAFSNDLDMRLHTQYLANEFSQFNRYFVGDQRRYGGDILWRGWSRQAWLAGVEYSDGVIERARHRPNAASPDQFVGRQERTVLGVFLQDQVTLSDSTQATLGARYDDNSEVGERITPRAAIAWRPAEHHVLKAQYAEGYRSPTFFELYTGATVPALDFEVNATTELNYVYQQPGLTARVTLYHAKISDMVFVTPPAGPPPPPPPVFANLGEAESDGVELEWSQQLNTAFRVDANATVLRSSDNRNVTLTTTDIGTAPDWMTNLGLLWTPVDDVLVGMKWNHVGPRALAAAADAEYDVVDLALTRRNLLVRGLDVRAGLANALDERITFLLAAPTGLQSSYYEFRTAWLGLTWNLP